MGTGTIISGVSDLRRAARDLFGSRQPVVVSHRGPVTYDVTPDGLQARAGAGGLAGALRSLSDHVPLTWASCAMSEGDRLAAAAGGADAPADASRLRLAVLPERVYQLHYEVASNPILWFVQHRIAEALAPGRDDEIEEAWEEGYRPANARLAATVADELDRPDTAPVVFVHDYQLYLLPGILRRLWPRLTISHFVHIPWPTPEAWEVLPLYIRREIVASLAAADIVGFQTRRDVAAFLACCRAWLPDARVDASTSSVAVGARRAHVRAYPISVDVDGVRALTADPSFLAHRARFAAADTERTIVRVDRLDPTKNVVRGFRAFERLLECRPEWRERVTFRSFLVPSRSTIPEYRRLAGEVFALVDRINLRFGTPAWQPIRLAYEHDREQALAGLSLADVMLVNPVADGMNLVAKEGAIVNDRDGVLVLSTTAGAYEELGPACLGVDPLDVAGTADALARALTMP
ncbi:MAG: trehalose-6-phosphate synthase, partial [Chloroflexota bacterium]|nr:trehalose-6-phosphate synthase [Chloroflexota bacterium]